MKSFLTQRMKPFLALFPFLTMGVSQGATIITVSHDIPGGTTPGGPGSGPESLTSNLGVISEDSGMPVITYTLTGVDLTAEGGTAAEQIVLNVSFSSNVRSPQYNTFGNISVVGGSNANLIDLADDEQLTTTVSLVSTTFGGSLTLDGFTAMRFGGFADAETADLTHCGGTDSVLGDAPADTHSISGTSFTIDPTSGDMALAQV